ncbi:MAG: hypothetical protein IPL75_03845 [Acidobacteria bacterium]|nr:hypothetical protein [Acidobacteriota bacterium]
MKPFGHYQKLLAQGVLEWLDADIRWLDELSTPLGAAVAAPAADGVSLDAEEAPPDALDPLVAAINALSTDRPRRVLDFIARDQRNRELGEQGEALVLDREQRRLHDTEGRPDLARQVEWVAKTQATGWDTTSGLSMRTAVPD